MSAGSKSKWGQCFHQPHARLHCARSILGDRHSVCLALSICRHRCLQAPWIGIPVVPEGTGFLRPATSPASGPVRRLVQILRPFPSTWRFRDRFSAFAVPGFPFRFWPKPSAFLLPFPAAGEATC